MKKTLFIGFLMAAFICLFSACDKDNEPGDYIDSYISGFYGGGKGFNLEGEINGTSLNANSYVKFKSPDYKKATVTFYDIIPDMKEVTFDNLLIVTDPEKGFIFEHEAVVKNINVSFTGAILDGTMRLDVNTSQNK